MVSSPGELNDGDTCSSIGGESSSSNNESTLSSIYSLNEALRLTVTYTEEWLCVARMPLDFTKAEFDKLLSEYGSVSQSFLIHSETSGKRKTFFRKEFWRFSLTFVIFFVVAKLGPLFIMQQAKKLQLYLQTNFLPPLGIFCHFPSEKWSYSCYLLNGWM